MGGGVILQTAIFEPSNYSGDYGCVTTTKSSDEVGSPWSLLTCNPR